jgi:RNA polymerase sigma-70 factor (ECF subfamily)
VQTNHAIAPAGAGETFEEFFGREYPTLVRLLYAMTGDVAEAEDLAQDAMSRVFERWATVRETASPAGYTYRTAVNLQRKRLRHLAVRARRLPLLPRPRSPEPHVRGELVSALAELPPDQRAAVLVTEWLGLTSEEAAVVLGVSAAAVRARVHRAHEHLRATMEDEDA